MRLYITLTTLTFSFSRINQFVSIMFIPEIFGPKFGLTFT